MRILLTGAGGQLGRAVQALAGERAVELIALERNDLDITDAESVTAAVRHHRPTHILNAAAYTAVDAAEAEPDRARAINSDGARHLATAATTHGARMLHVSTDYVFDGRQSRPYRADDTPNPINVYGASKQAGEQAVLEATHGEGLILRTAWVFAATGRNFLTTMRRLLHERDEVAVVEDEIGTPTHAADLAETLLDAAALGLTGIHHWTNAGVASWYDFAVAIRDHECRAGRLQHRPRIRPIPQHEFQRSAARPAYSVLDRTALRQALGREGRHWQEPVAAALAPTHPGGDGESEDQCRS